MIKVAVYFKNGESVEIVANSIDFRNSELCFYGKDGRLFATFYKDSIAGWVIGR